MSDFQALYEFGRLIRRGSLGILLEAKQVALQRSVAVRVIAEDLTDEDQKGRELLKRIDEQGRADSPILVPILERGELQGRTCYAMDRFKARDLDKASGADFGPAPGEDSTYNLPIRSRLDELRSFLSHALELHTKGVNLDHLREAEVLVIRPLRFMLSEPGLAALADGEGGPGIGPIIQKLLELVLDASWGAEEGAEQLANLMSTDERSRLFLDVTASAPSSTTAAELRRAIDVLSHDPSHRESHRQVVPTGSSSITARSKQTRTRVRIGGRSGLRIFAVACMLGSLGLLSFARIRLQSRINSLEERATLESLLNDGDKPSLSELQTWTGSTEIASHPDLARDVQNRLSSEISSWVDQQLLVTVDALASDGAQSRPDTTVFELDELRERIDLAVEGPWQEFEAGGELFRSLLSESAGGRIEAFDNFIRLHGDFSEPLRRAVLGYMCTVGDPDMRRGAAAAISAGLGGATEELDQALKAQALSGRTPAKTRALLLGYFALHKRPLAREVFEELLARRGPDIGIPDLQTDPIIVRPLRLLLESDDPLVPLFGTPAEPRTKSVTIRGLAALGLIRIADDPLEQAITLLEQAPRDAAFTVARLLSNKKEMRAEGDLVRALDTLLNRGDTDLAKPVCMAITDIDLDRGRLASLRALSRRQPGDVRGLGLALALRERGLLRDPGELAELLRECHPAWLWPLASEIRHKKDHAVQGLAHALLDISLGGEVVARRAAMLAGFLSSDDVRAAEILGDAIYNTTLSTATRRLVLTALLGTSSIAGARLFSDCIVDSELPAVLRVRAAAEVGKEVARAVGRTSSRISSSLKIVVPADNRRAAELIAGLARALGDEKRAVRTAAAFSLIPMDHQIAIQRIIRQLREADIESQEFAVAARYLSTRFTQLAPDQFDELDSQVTALLEEPIAPGPLTDLISYCTWRNSTDASELVAEILVGEGDEDLLEQCLEYMAARLEPRFLPELQIFLEIAPSSKLKATAVDLLKLSRAPESFLNKALNDDNLSSPAVLLRLAEAVQVVGGSPTVSPVVEAVRLAGQQRATALSTGTSSASTDASDAELPWTTSRILLRMPFPEFDDALVEDTIQWRYDAEEISDAAAILLARANLYQSDEARFLRLLAGSDISLDEWIDVWAARLLAEGPTLRSSGVTEYGDEWYVSALFRDAHDFLLHSFPRKSPLHRANAQLLLRDLGTLRPYNGSLRQSELAPSRELGSSAYRSGDHGKTLERAIESLEAAIHLGDPMQNELRLTLAKLLRSNGQPELALHQLQVLQGKTDVDPVFTDAFLRELQSHGLLREVRRELERTEDRRGAEYWRRRLEVEIALADDPASVLLKELPQCLNSLDSGNASGLHASIAPALRELFDRTDERLEPLRLQLAHRFADILIRDYGWQRRLAAAIHLGWLGRDEHRKPLRRAAEGDTQEEVRRAALIALYSVSTEHGVECAKNRVERNDEATIRTALWILLREDRAAGIKVARGRVGSTPMLAAIRAFHLDELSDDIARVALDSPSVEARLAAVECLSDVVGRGNRKHLETLRMVAATDSEEVVQTMGRRALSTLRDPTLLASARETVAAFLSRPRYEVADLILLDAVKDLRYDDSESTEKLRAALAEGFAKWRGVSLGLSKSGSLLKAARAKRDDEVIGDLGDEAYLSGQLSTALDLYQEASRYDPGDSEWTGKIYQLQNGGIVDVDYETDRALFVRYLALTVAPTEAFRAGAPMTFAAHDLFNMLADRRVASTGSQLDLGSELHAWAREAIIAIADGVSPPEPADPTWAKLTVESLRAGARSPYLLALFGEDVVGLDMDDLAQAFALDLPRRLVLATSLLEVARQKSLRAADTSGPVSFSGVADALEAAGFTTE